MATKQESNVHRYYTILCNDNVTSQSMPMDNPYKSSNIKSIQQQKRQRTHE